MRTHGKISTYNHGCTCAECRLRATVKRSEYRHRGRTLRYECKVCGRWFPSVIGLATHEGKAH